MMDGEDRYARLAARLLVTQAEQAELPAAGGRRDSVVAAMALAIAAKRRRRRAVVATGVALAMAAAVLLMVKASVRTTSPSASVDIRLRVERMGGAGHALVRGPSSRPLADGDRVAEGDAVEAQQDGNVTLAFPSGTRVTLSAAARLHVDALAATRRLSLEGGNLEAHVAKLGPGERFIVDTPDAEVEVRGTVFSIAIAAADHCLDRPLRSKVTVSEGAVSVHAGTSQVLLHPGESWSVPCTERAATAPAAVEPPTQPEPSTKAIRTAHPARHAVSASPTVTPGPAATPVPPAPPASSLAPVPVVRQSHLAEQNNLLSTAMAAEHRGDHATALANLQQLIERFPTGPLVESARAERQRILSAQPTRQTTPARPHQP